MSPARPRVLVTRPAGLAGELSAVLRDSGCEPVEVPSIAIVPVEDPTALDAALERLDSYDWLLLTSRNAVEMLFSRLRVLRRNPPRSLRWGAIGPGTAAALAARSVQAWTPSRYLSETLAGELPVRPGQRVLRLRAQEAADIAPRLHERGAVVDEVVVYRTFVAPPESIPLLRRAWADGLDAVVLASASTARGFVALARAAGCADGVGDLPVLAIGPVTAEAAAAAGLRVEWVADEHSLAGIAAVIRRRLGHDVRHIGTR